MSLLFAPPGLLQKQDGGGGSTPARLVAADRCGVRGFRGVVCASRSGVRFAGALLHLKARARTRGFLVQGRRRPADLRILRGGRGQRRPGRRSAAGRAAGWKIEAGGGARDVPHVVPLGRAASAHPPPREMPLELAVPSPEEERAADLAHASNDSSMRGFRFVRGASGGSRPSLERIL